MFENRQGGEKKPNIFSLKKRTASGSSWIWTLAPPCNYHQTTDCAPKDERTRLNPPQPQSSPSCWAHTPHIWKLFSKVPSDNYTHQCDMRSRRLLGERAESVSGDVPSILPAMVIWSSVWQWAVGLWNVPRQHLHTLLHYIWIFGFAEQILPEAIYWSLDRKHQTISVYITVIQ